MSEMQFDENLRKKSAMSPLSHSEDLKQIKVTHTEIVFATKLLSFPQIMIHEYDLTLMPCSTSSGSLLRREGTCSHLDRGAQTSPSGPCRI